MINEKDFPDHGDNCSIADYEIKEDDMPDIDYWGKTISDLEFETGNG